MADRTALAALILEVLQNEQSMRARHLVARLREKIPDKAVTIHEINSILYRDLARKVIRNENYEWSLGPREPAIMGPVSAVRANEGRAVYLRVIQRLRSGLPPDEKVGELTVGDHHEVMREILRSRRGWLLVVGEYGHGKTHTLQLFQNEAQQQRYATCRLAADAAASALNHPQRFLPVLLGTLEIAGRNIRGYQDLLYEVLDDPATVSAIQSFVARRLSEATLLRVEIDQVLRAMQGTTDAANILNNKQRLASLLAGDSISARFADPATRRQAYELLGVAQDITTGIGAQGIAFLIDEAESIYTKLPRSLSRYGAYRTLSAICMSPQLDRCRVAIAVTPDAYGDLREIDVAAARYGCLSAEPLEAWATAIREEQIALIMCRPFSVQDKSEFLARVHGLYQRAYPEFCLTDNKLAAWQGFHQGLSSATIPTRIAIRRVVDFLDLQRWDHNPTRE